MEAKAQLVGIRDWVRSDIEGTQPPTSSVSSKAQGEGRRVAAATNPSAEDAAELLRYVAFLFFFFSLKHESC